MTRNAVFFFAAFLLSVLIGFWPTYFTRIGEMPSWRAHVHGALLFAWCVLLVAQAWLIRTQRRDLHRALGKISYLLIPLMVVSSLVVEHHALVRAAGKYDAETLFFLYMIFALLLQLILAYSLSMVNRHTPALHMRYMICTPLVMFDPVFARILGVQFGIGFGTGQMITFSCIDAILLWLCYLDRNTTFRVFPFMFVAFVLTQIPAFFVYKTPWWPAVARWFVGLPLP